MTFFFTSQVSLPPPVMPLCQDILFLCLFLSYGLCDPSVFVFLDIILCLFLQIQCRLSHIFLDLIAHLLYTLLLGF